MRHLDINSSLFGEIGTLSLLADNFNNPFSKTLLLTGAGHRVLPEGGPGGLRPDSEVRVQERGWPQPAQDRVPGNIWQYLRQYPDNDLITGDRGRRTWNQTGAT